MYIKLKQLTINKCTLLDCTNTEILMYCIYPQYTPSTLFWYRHTHKSSRTHNVFVPLGHCIKIAL